MKYNRIKLALIGGVLITSMSLNAQNSNVVSAAVEYKKYGPAFMMQKFDEAKEVLLKSKEYIDPAMEHESTKDEPKAHYYNAVIHFGLVELSSVPENKELQKFQSEETMAMIENSFKIAHSNRKFKRDVEDFINQRVTMANTMGAMMFEQEEYANAFAGFAGAYQLQKMIDIDDQDMKNNALVSAQNAIATMKNNGEYDEALEFINVTQEFFPKNTEIIIQGVNIALEQGNMEKAEELFNAAIEADPENVVLFTSMGSIFLSSGDQLAGMLKGMDNSDPNFSSISEQSEEMYEKAEKNLSRALELDPKNLDAAYNLGVLYLGKGEKLTVLANQMDFNDPRYDETVAKSEEMYTKAIDPLEVYIEQDPENAGVLQVLFQVHRKAGNTEKALEYKKRAEEAAGN